MSGESLARLARRFFFQRGMILLLAEDMDESDWACTVGDDGNSAHWVLGHIAHSRRNLLRSLDVELAAEPWEPLFGRGVTPEPPAAYPPAATLLDDIHEVGKRLTARLEAITDAEADVELERPMPDGGTTIADRVRFFHFHEAYHVGQLGLLRRIAGRKGLI